MANKNKSNTGLRFLWIPGRKKHQHKGRMDTTNKQPHYGRPQNRPNEPWALGGSKGHRELIKADNVDAEGVTAASCTTALSVPAVASTVAVAATSDDPNHSKDGGEQSSGASAAASCEPSKVTQETHFGPETLDERATMYPPDLHNTATLLISDRKNGAIRKKPRKGDLDSIDRLDDDCVDAIKLRNGTTTIKGHTYKEPVEEKENEKTVTCLYYTLQCCECTIS